MVRLITLFSLLCIMMFSAVTAESVDCDYTLYTSSTSPYALFYAKGFDFQSVTSTFTASGDIAAYQLTWYLGGPMDAVDIAGPTSLSSSNSITITKSLLESHDFSTGVYHIGSYMHSDIYMTTAGWIYYQGGNVIYNLTPVSSNLGSKTVVYSYSSSSGLYGTRSYQVFQPNGVVVGGGSISDSGNISITFGQRGPYGVAAEGLPAPADPPCECFCPGLHHVDGAVETPAIELADIISSTSGIDPENLPTPYYPFSGNYSIEPAYADYVRLYWKKTYNEFHATNIVILQEDSTGSIEDPNDPGKKYKVIDDGRIALGTPTDNGIGASGGWQYTGEVRWPEEGTHLPQCQAGSLRIGFEFDDGYVQLTNKYINVLLSVYDVKAVDSSILNLGHAGSTGSSSIFYTLSSNTSLCSSLSINVNVGSAKVLAGSGSKGTHEVEWNGRNTAGELVQPGPYALTFNLPSSQSGVSLGSTLAINNLEYDSSFMPVSSEVLTVAFRLREPVIRPHATSAKLTAVVYDAWGQLVKVLANESTGSLDNQTTGSSNGYNEIEWDGTDERGEIVDPGQYTVSLVAEDNAGERCQSDRVNFSVSVVDPPPTANVLMWPSFDQSYSGEGPDAVCGYTNSGGSVTFSVDGGTVGPVNDLLSNGAFFIDVSNLVGEHTVTVSTSSPTLGNTTIDVPFFRNTYDIAVPADYSRFDPQTSGNGVGVQLNAATSDTVRVDVVNPFYQTYSVGGTSCISSEQPIPVSDLLNGFVSTKLVKTVDSSRAIAQGANSIQWDGKDSSGAWASPGVYEIVVSRVNDDNRLDIYTLLPVVIEHLGGPQLQVDNPVVIGSSVTISWTTAASTNGYVLFESEEGLRGKLSSGTTGSNHSLCLPGTTPDTTYHYYVVAEDSVTHTTTISDRQSVTTGSGTRIGTSGVQFEENQGSIQCRVDYSSALPVAAAIEYAQVGPGTNAPQWQRAEHTYKDTQHMFTFDVQSNAEYVYRIVSSEDGNWSNATKSRFDWFTTETDFCSVSITNINDMEGVSDISDVVVRASDSTNTRFSDHGITSIELYIDGQPVNSVTKSVGTDINGTDYTEYVFHAASMQIGDGVHMIEAVASDDYWNKTHCEIYVMVDSGANVATGGTLASATIGSTSAETGVPVNTRAAAAKQEKCKLWYSPRIVIAPDLLEEGHAFITIRYDDNGYGLYPKTIPGDLLYGKGTIRFDKPKKRRLVLSPGGLIPVSLAADVPYSVNRVYKDIADALIQQANKDYNNTPDYDLFARYNTSQKHQYYNCATWTGKLFKDVKNDGGCTPSFLPSNIGSFASCLNSSSKR